MKIPLIKVSQPIGSFYISAIEAETLIKITEVENRKYDKLTQKSIGGVQRAISSKRVKEITNYTSDPDATFPTPIIISVTPSEDYQLSEDGFFEFDENQKIGYILDGQHRVEGLKYSENISNFQLPIILMFNLEEEEKAYIFSIINSKQTQVNQSLIYDLFNLSKGHSPQKTCHEIARLFNSDENSPFYRRLKMLGNKEEEKASLSQGSFIKYLMPLISKNPDDDYINIKNGMRNLQDNEQCPLRYYFIRKEDNIIYKILLNVFKALKDTFPQEWNNPEQYILTKTTGYAAIMLALKPMIIEGKENKDLSYDYFKNKFDALKARLEANGKELTSKHFASNAQEQRKLSKLILGEEE